MQQAIIAGEAKKTSHPGWGGEMEERREMVGWEGWDYWQVWTEIQISAFSEVKEFYLFLQQQACNYLDFIEWVWVWSDLRL